MSVFPITFEQNNILIEFDRKGGGFPTTVAFKESDKQAEEAIISTSQPHLNLSLGDGRTLRPYITDDCDIKRYTINDDCERIEFNTLLLVDENENAVDKFRLSLRHEFWSDGTAFSTAFFLVEDNNVPAITRFEISIPLNLDAYEKVHWGYFPRPQSNIDGTFIQTVKTECFIEPGVNRVFDEQLVPDINFNCYRKNDPCTYFEFFMEGQNALSGKANDCCSSIIWGDNNDVTLNWNFQKNLCHNQKRPWQWQNQWGWVIAKAPTERRLPPLKMYHYFDNFQRYPTSRQMKKIIDADADILIFHENWRLDPQNGSVPYDHKRFSELVQQAKDKHIRLAVYMRGDEISMVEEHCDWFDHLLIKGKDGLYIDYGGPVHETIAPTERFNGGRIAFRNHYMKLRYCRQRVGDSGVLLVHTGPFFSALGMTADNIDGYVAGEGEKGALIESRCKHEYYSEAYVCHGTMWTAAFPEYGTARMIPYLAATGQAPHAPLGTQIQSSSLSYYGEPGLNDVYMRPLWKLWQLFKTETNLSVFNDYNCYQVLNHANEYIGGYLMITQDKSKALLILANFSDQTQKALTSVDWEQTGLDIATCLISLCQPTTISPGKATIYRDQTNFSCVIQGYGVAGWLISKDREWVKNKLEFYEKSYPSLDEFDREYQDHVKKQKWLRNQTHPFKTIYLKVSVPELAVPYEDSLFWDLYENSLELGFWDSDDNFHPIGWVDKNGLSETPPEQIAYIWPGECSTWIPLHGYLAPGRYKLGIRSFHHGDSFYSFICISISPEMNDMCDNSYKLEYKNELEASRNCLSWMLTLE